MMRSDEKLVSESGMLGQHAATSTPVSHAKDEGGQESNLEECVSKIKISCYDDDSPQAGSSETGHLLACNTTFPLEPPVGTASLPVAPSGCEVGAVVHKASPTVKTSGLEADVFVEQAGHDPGSALGTSENESGSPVRERHSRDSSSAVGSSVCEASSPLESSVFNTSSCTESASLVESTCSSGSEDRSSASTSLDDSSVCSPRGCFYYMTDQMSTSSIINSSSCDAITISSDSEEEAGGHAGERKTAKVSEVLLTSGSDDDVILVDDRS